MARALARKKPTRERPAKADRTVKKAIAKANADTRVLSKRRPPSRLKSAETQSKRERYSKQKGSREDAIMEAEGRKVLTIHPQTGATGSSRLLKETKTTAAALSLLEKAIKLIYEKDFKKARAELKTLIETYPAETEILAQARTYVRICEREEATHKRPAVTNDQLYTLGVMAHNRGDYDSAISYFRQSFEKHKDADYIYYSLAASMAMKGDIGEAASNLRKAIEINEENRVYAKNDSDFSSLHSCKEFTDLVGISPASPSE